MGRVEPKSQRYIATKERGPLRDTEVLQKRRQQGLEYRVTPRGPSFRGWELEGKLTRNRPKGRSVESKRQDNTKLTKEHSSGLRKVPCSRADRIIDSTRYSLRLEGVRPQLRQETEQAQVRGEVASTDGRKADRIAMASVKMQAVVVDITILEEQTRRRQWSN